MTKAVAATQRTGPRDLAAYRKERKERPPRHAWKRMREMSDDESGGEDEENGRWRRQNPPPVARRTSEACANSGPLRAEASNAAHTTLARARTNNTPSEDMTLQKRSKNSPHATPPPHAKKWDDCRPEKS